MGERGGVKILGGRASWRAIALAGSCPIRLGGSLALPMSVGFEFFTPSAWPKAGSGSAWEFSHSFRVRLSSTKLAHESICHPCKKDRHPGDHHSSGRCAGGRHENPPSRASQPGEV